MKKTTFLSALILLFAANIATYAQGGTAKVQVIHNSADVSIATVDVYVMGMLQYPDAPFRTCTTFQDVPAGFPLTIQLAPGDSTSAADSFYSTTVTLEAGKTYIAIATGTRTDNGYTPYKPFNVAITNAARLNALDPANTDILLFQGSTDLPAVNAIEPGVGTIVNNVPYGQFLGYLPRATENYEISVVNPENGNVIGNYYADFESLDLQGKAVTILGSGFLNPANNSNGATFGLWMATPQGGQLIDMSQQTASVNKNIVANISVYPNPASSNITINVPAGFSKINSVLYDIMGREVANTDTNTINIAGLSNGIYIVKANIDGKIYQQRIIKK